MDVGYKVALETEQVAQGILDNLHKDRETLTRSSQRVNNCCTLESVFRITLFLIFFYVKQCYALLYFIIKV